jgi:Domain of unknown function (DUF4157)
VLSHQHAKAQSASKAPSPREWANKPSAPATERVTQAPTEHEPVASWNFSQVPLFPPAPNPNDGATPWSSKNGSRGKHAINLSAIQFQPLTPEPARDATQGDGSLEDLSDDQDSLTPSVFERKPSGRGVHIRVNGGHPGPTPEYPDGIRWIQTIDTTAPLFGQTPPYVDFIPPKDDKPFYFSDALEVTQGGTFSDNPSRTANNIRWDASLSLVGVSGRTVTRIDSVNYGFDLSSTGTLTLHGPSSTGTISVVVQGDTLRSEYPDWNFSGGFAVPQVPAPGNAGVNGVAQASRISSSSSQPAAYQQQPMGAARSDAAPPIVSEVVRSPGEPLHPETREFMESRFNHDFSRIRVHADPKAAESAATIAASAYTVGNHVVFGQNRYAPGTSETRRLLAHELRHTQQQSERPATGPLTVAPPNTHLERDAEETARRTVSDRPGPDQPVAGSEYGSGVPQAARLIQRDPVPPSAGSTPQLTMPQVGDSLRQPTQPFIPIPQLAFHLSTQDQAQIDGFLTTHHLAVGSGFQPSLDGNVTTIDAITDAIRPLVLALVSRSEIEDAVRARYSPLVRAALFNVRITVPDMPVPNDITSSVPAAPGAAAPTANPITLTAGTNFAWHVNLSGPRTTSNDKTLQLQVGEDAPLQRIFQISYNLNNQQVQVVVGGQATADLDLIEHILKLSGFVQVLAGVAWTGTPASGVFTVVQPSVGAQLTLTWHGIQFSVQAAGSVTAVQGQPPTAEFNITPQITIPFGGPTPRPHRVDTSELTGLFEVRDWVDRANYSDIERLPTEEKSRLIGIILRGTVINMDVDSVSRIWHSIDSAGERQQIRQVIEARIPDIDNPDMQTALRHLLTEQ